MPIFRNYQTNFSGGLLSEGMLGRADLAQYENGCKQLLNWWPKVTGGMRRRPGSKYLNVISNGIRIESFIFSEDQTYLFVFRAVIIGGPPGDTHHLSIFDPETGDELQQITFTGILFNATVIREMSITQLGDVMFLAHRRWKMVKIVRTSATTFEQQEFVFEGTPGNGFPKFMPFVKFAPLDSTITVNGIVQGSTVTITCSVPFFEDRHVGKIIRYRGKQILISNVGGGQPTLTCLGVIKEKLDPGAVLGFNNADDEPKDFKKDEIIVGRDSGVKAQVIETTATSILVAMIAGKFAALTTEQVEGLTSGNIATLTANSTVDPPASADWDEEAFSDVKGWPSVIEFHSQRLWLGGSSSLPAHIFGSRVAAFFNYNVGDAFPADSIQAAIVSKQINLITDIVSGRHLQVFTDKGEFYAPQSEDRPLIPETFDLLRQTKYGSKPTIEPKVFDESTLFVQAQGSAIREFIWSDRSKGYTADAISLIAEEHLNDVQELEVLYGGYDRPEQIAFFINGDGTITWYHAARAENIRTWGKWDTQGLFESLTVIQDKLYVMVDRDTDSEFFGEEKVLERFELDLTLDAVVQKTGDNQDQFQLDEEIHDGITLSVVSGDVDFDADYYIGEFTVDSAFSVVTTTPLKLDNVSVGYNFEQVLEIMPIEIKDRDGLSTGLSKRIISADIYLASTLAVRLNGNKVLTFLGENDLTEKPEAITGVRKFYLLGYSERPTLEIRNFIPLACEVLSLGAEVEY